MEQVIFIFFLSVIVINFLKINKKENFVFYFNVKVVEMIYVGNVVSVEISILIYMLLLRKGVLNEMLKYMKEVLNLFRERESLVQCSVIIEIVFLQVLG